MGLCSSSTCVHFGQRLCNFPMASASSYQKSSGNEDQDTAGLVGGLGVQAGDFVLHLAEWQTLRPVSISFPHRSAWQWRAAHTTSFSVMAAAPWTGEFSKVSMEWSFCCPQTHQISVSLKRCVFPYVKSAEGLTVLVEGLVVELSELLCVAGQTRGRFSNRGSGAEIIPAMFWKSVVELVTSVVRVGSSRRI